MAAPDLILGLGHRKRVGKDTLAEMLEAQLEEHGYEVHRIAFAHDMKELAADIFRGCGLRGPEHYEMQPQDREYVLPLMGKTPRQIWIEFGNAMRAIDPDVWIRRIRQYIESAQFYWTRPDVLKPLAFIITDVRYTNETEAIKSWGGTLVKVTRDSAPRSDDVADCALDGFDGWDHYVRNDGDLDNLWDLAYLLTLQLTL